MTEIADDYRTRADALTEKITNVGPDQWDNPSPCEDWTARDVVDHLVTTSGMFFTMVGLDAPETPAVADDPVAAWLAARAAMEAALDDPERATIEYEGALGRSTFEQSVQRFICADLVIHNWDLSRATGQDEHLEPAYVHEMYEAMEPLDDLLRSPGAFGPKVEPPAGADEQTQLLCFLGRQV